MTSQTTQQIGPWTAVLTWDDDADPAAGPVAIEVRAEDGSPSAAGISTTVLRQIDLKRPRGIESIHSGIRVQHSRAIRQAFATGGLCDEYLIWLSIAYIKATGSGAKNVTGQVAEWAGKKPDTIRTHLKEARKRNLLSSVPGKAGGQLTEKGSELLWELTEEAKG